MLSDGMTLMVSDNPAHKKTVQGYVSMPSNQAGHIPLNTYIIMLAYYLDNKTTDNAVAQP